jgi:hypothetical protein
LANFLSVSPDQSKFFPFVCLVPANQPDISAILDSVSVVSESYQLNYRWILKLLSGPRICKLLTLCGNQLQYTLAAYAFVPSVFGESIPTAEFVMLSTETACWDIERK